MRPDDLVIIITHCSKDKAFIFKNIEQCLKVTNNVIVSCGNKLFDGRDENFEHFSDLRKAFPQIKILVFDVDLKENNPLQHRKNAYFPNKSRVLAYKHAILEFQEIEWFLFIDSDEIPEGDLLSYVLFNTQDFTDEKTFTFANYWYFREPIYQATTFESSPLLVHINNVDESTLMTDAERNYYNAYQGRKNTVNYLVFPHTKKPVFHHYSWVRSKEKMFDKIKGWSHQDDTDWNKIIEDEFTHDFLMKDPIHGYEYKIVKNIFDLKDY